MSSFFAKLLLFGEYTILNGGSALAIPFPAYKGQWRASAHTDLDGFFDHLLDIEGVLADKVQQAKRECWQFESSIPMGYGLGSSGALTAAAFHSLFAPELSFDVLRKKLSEIESYFHGKSSGLDPMTCLTGMDILVKDNKIQRATGFRMFSQLHIYDSGLARDGKPFIRYFLEKQSSDSTFAKVVAELSNKNQLIIDSFLGSKDEQEIQNIFREISHLQFNHFHHMIPEEVLPVWKKGLEDETYYMKLSGAGGGGCFLVWVKDNPENHTDFQAIETNRSWVNPVKLYRTHYLLCNFENEARLRKFMEEKYDEESDDTPISEFAASQGWTFYDHDFVESYMLRDLRHVLIDHHYPDVDLDRFNAIIKVQDEEFDTTKRLQSAEGEGFSLSYLGHIEWNYLMLGQLAARY